MALIEYNENYITIEKIINEIESLEYEATLVNNNDNINKINIKVIKFTNLKKIKLNNKITIYKKNEIIEIFKNKDSIDEITYFNKLNMFNIVYNKNKIKIREIYDIFEKQLQSEFKIQRISTYSSVIGHFIKLIKL